MTPRSGRLTESPFAADELAAARIAALAADVGEAFAARVASLAAAAGDAAFVPADGVTALVAAFGLGSLREAAILAIPAAATLARPPISDYHVGAVGLTPGGALVLGGNLEFPDASIHHTVHGEGFVVLHARALGVPISELAIREARPCAHCRQVLAEMAWADDLRIVDPLGHDLALRDLYPWPFTPADLDQAGWAPGGSARPDVRRMAPVEEEDVAAALARAGARAHAAYSGEPAAIVLRTAGGTLVEGAVLESVAFNPTIGPLQDALVGLTAVGTPYSAIREAWLAVVGHARVDHVGPTHNLLAAVAPAATLHVTYWS